MDFLAAEIARKRKEIASTRGDEPNKKYIRQKDVAAERERRYQEDQARLKAEREAKVQAKLEETLKREAAARAREARVKKEKEDKLAWELSQQKVTTDEEVISRLRELGEPINLFAETSEARKERLEAAELKAVVERKKKARQEAAKLDDTPELEPLETLSPDAEELKLDLSDFKKNPEKLQAKLYRYFKVMCQEWTKSIHERDPEVKNSREGIAALNIQQSCIEDFRPLFKALKRKVSSPPRRANQKNLEYDIIPLLTEIFYYAQQRDYLQASDAYYKLSIGNAAWPIGVVAVGIHERSSADKIQYASHVFNDEATRKWVQGIKRWLTWAQAKWPPSDRRRMMG
jgi:pre-mRNA-splicing factor 18